MMRLRNILRSQGLITWAFLVGLLAHTVHAEAKTQHHSGQSKASTHRVVTQAKAKTVHTAQRGAAHSGRYARRGQKGHGGHRLAWQGGPRLQCVPYARRVSGIALKGNAYTWWDEADGRYAKGQYPEPGAVLSFQRSERMELGHVAVVTGTVNPREIVITQANWPGARHGNISQAVSVIDVSPDNDWTAVRVQIGHSDRYGAVYRTNGFIYGRSPATTLMASANQAGAAAGAAAGKQSLWSQSIQLASAPSYNGPAIAETAPDRSLR